MSEQVSCPHCDTVVANDARTAGQNVSCPNCSGQFQMPIPQAVSFSSDQPPPETHRHVYIHTPPKNSGIAAVLSFFWSGAGQIYNGQIGKGLLFIVLHVVCALLCIVLIGIPLLFALWVWSIYDAYSTAEQINADARRQEGR